MRALIEEAARLGVQVHIAQLDGEERGFYSHQQKLIAVRLGMSRAQLREAIAHELGHAYYGHECSQDPRTDAEFERQADRRGSYLLVDPAAYIAAEALNAHPNYIAAELVVTPHVIKVWQDWWLPKLPARGRRALSASAG